VACRGDQVSFNTTVGGDGVVLLKDIIQLTGVSGRLKARKNGFGERFQVLGESGGAPIRLAVLS
jgi:hypothetical protein